MLEVPANRLCHTSPNGLGNYFNIEGDSIGGLQNMCSFSHITTCFNSNNTQSSCIAQQTPSPSCVKRKEATDVPPSVPDDILRPRSRDRITPFSVSTPTTEAPSYCDSTHSYSSDYLSRKVKRMSRLYTNQPSVDLFAALEVDQSLLEYLVLHGALSKEASENILSSESRSRKLLLLNALGLPSTSETMFLSDSSFPTNPAFATGLALLLNALRQTGHHTLANYLDVGRRITPSPCWSSNGGKQGDSISAARRRRGQLSVWIQLDAIKINPVAYRELNVEMCHPERAYRHVDPGTDSTPATTNANHSSEQATTQNKFPPMLPSFVEYLDYESRTKSPPTGPNSSLWIDHYPHTKSTLQPHPECQSACETRRPSGGNLHRRKAGCFSKLWCLFGINKKKITKNRVTSICHIQPPMSSTLNDHPVPTKDSGMSDLPPKSAGNTHQSCDELQCVKLALLDTKSNEFYNVLLDPSSAIHDAMVKYFEQSCGVLVLDSQLCENKLGTSPAVPVPCVTVVATQTEVVGRLRDAYKPDDLSYAKRNPPSAGSKLANDFTTVMVQNGILAILQLQDLRLSIMLDPSELDLAIEELSDMVE
ncbi:hypothetical protein EG68_05124 [Paragonimus skrjabini miyazakii]|uniref:Uncharacterized protein n=1 Tax=Paragonimus skrjabini miyazakii TaxID=59628 RepID=A0A8S9Z3C4_9TREM|nr:hypothetical protein EG68_05124 [Paragonimus skrjabini miyazakii]